MHIRTQLKVVLVKACDISNEVRPMEVSEPWVDCLLEEYFMQSDREKSEGLPVAPFMDREKVTKPTAQIGFIKFVLLPMYQQLYQVGVVKCTCRWVWPSKTYLNNNLLVWKLTKFHSQIVLHIRVLVHVHVFLTFCIYHEVMVYMYNIIHLSN